jgi:hypothetical protein
MTHNPFKPAAQTARYLKVLLFGGPGSGKTRAALSFPGCAVVDAEGGTTLYRGRPGIAPFLVMDAKTLSELESAVDFIEADKGKSVKTLVIDPISVFYKVQREATAKTNKRGEMGFREWGKLNMRMGTLYTRLTNLPCHVVVIARETTEYEGTGDDMRRVGMKPDSDGQMAYIFDFVVHLQADHTGRVVKSRGAELGEGQRLKSVSWETFEPFARAYENGTRERLTEDDSAVAAETDHEIKRDEFQDRDTVEAFVKEWKAQGMSVKDITDALKIDKWSQWTQGVAAARAVMRDYVGADTKPETQAS